jgi:hypothetical protein
MKIKILLLISVLCVSFLVGVFMQTEKATAACADDRFTEVNGVCFPNSTSLPSSDIRIIITNALNWLLAIFGLLAIIAFIISGVQYILSTGSEQMIDTAKRNMTWSIVGVIVALSGLIIIYAIDKLLRGVSYF